MSDGEQPVSTAQAALILCAIGIFFPPLWLFSVPLLIIALIARK